jgi:predicted thioesterase
MKNPFEIGEKLQFTYVVKPEDTAAFAAGEVHPVYATFALAREAEWSGRLFVLEMKEEGEEGIGTSITVMHHSPALVGDEVVFTATLTGVNGNEVCTSYEAYLGKRLVASGTQTQKIVIKAKLDRLFESLKQ